uniref:Uncharacterized protein n=1 Tax=Mus musculus TaxID=10090 RepID=Q3UZ15_MOUSE|nr:unnamed protein product [Mus musculus]
MPVCNGTCRCAMGHAGVQWDMPVCSGTCQCAVGHAGVQWDMPVCNGTCRCAMGSCHKWFFWLDLGLTLICLLLLLNSSSVTGKRGFPLWFITSFRLILRFPMLPEGHSVM